jgi:hypothetical protein
VCSTEHIIVKYNCANFLTYNDPEGHYAHPSPSSWFTTAAHPFPNTPTLQKVFFYMEEVEYTGI